MQDIVKSAKQRMEKVIETFQTELTKLRTGRAHSSLLDHIQVDYYGNATPIPRVATVVVEDARTLLVTPWEKDMVAAVGKAIEIANLGLHPSVSGSSVRVPLPALTEESRKNFIKLLREQAEKARVAIRNVRRDINAFCKSQHKEKEMTEDDVHALHTEVQELTDQYIAQIDQLSANKEQDLMEI